MFYKETWRLARILELSPGTFITQGRDSQGQLELLGFTNICEKNSYYIACPPEGWNKENTSSSWTLMYDQSIIYHLKDTPQYFSELTIHFVIFKVNRPRLPLP